MQVGEKVAVTIGGKIHCAKFIRQEVGFSACKVEIESKEWIVKPEEVQDTNAFLKANKLVIDLTRLKTNTRRNVSEVTEKSLDEIKMIVNVAKGLGILT